MKRSLLISGVLATAVAAFGLSGVSSSELDLPGLNQRIDSIDARTTNNEADIQVLQQSTGTTPAEHVVVPVVQAAPDPTAVPTSPAPVAENPTAVHPDVATPAPTPAPTPVPCFPTPAPNQAQGISVVVYQPEGYR